jgi:hypothetical protein
VVVQMHGLAAAYKQRQTGILQNVMRRIYAQACFLRLSMDYYLGGILLTFRCMLQDALEVPHSCIDWDAQVTTWCIIEIM